MTLTAGIDIGSTTTKVVILENGIIKASDLRSSGVVPAETGGEIFALCLKDNSLTQSDLDAVATTGYGRRLMDIGDMVITEIRACARGAVQTSDKKLGTVIDMGGQDTKVIVLDDEGGVEDFYMNDKCAAGTGRFLEMLAAKLELDWREFIDAAESSTKDIRMNATCAVFAESEVVSLLARGTSKEDIAAAAHRSAASRAASLVRRSKGKGPFFFAGGGAGNKALARALSEELGEDLIIPHSPQLIVALGAATVAANRVEKQ